MYNKRLLLLGISFIGSGWIYPTQADISVISKGVEPLPRPANDTERVATTASLSATVANSSSEGVFFKELFMAASVGGSNGVRLNPKALSFVQDYMKENWDELQGIRTWGQPYFNLIENILTQYGLPKELKYLPVIESNLKAAASSWVCTKVPWLIDIHTARDLRQKVNR